MIRQPQTDPGALRRALRFIFSLHRTIEIRVLKVERSFGRPVNMAGFFDNAEAAAKAILALPRCRAVYWTINVIPVDLLAIRANRFDLTDENGLTADRHISRRVVLLLDLDPMRPHSEISSTDIEHDLAATLASEIMTTVADGYGWPLPLLVDSGNGFQLWYRIDLPADDGGLIKRLLAALAAKFDTPAVEIDTSVFNAARITKLPGTVARKGDHIPSRPHRVARIMSQIESFDEVDVVTLPLLEAMAATAPATAAATRKTTSFATRRGASWPTGDAARAALEADLARWGLRSGGTKTSGTIYTMHLAACPFDPTHTAKDAAVSVDLATGARGFHCFHNSCQGRTHRDFLDRVAPGERQRPDRNSRKMLINDHAMRYALEHGYV